MNRALSTACAIATLGLVSVVYAEVQKPTEVPKDPTGVRGISPFWEAVNRGDAAFIAQNLDGAASEYRAAITSAPKNSVGHLRMAELSLKQGELTQAQEFISSAIRFSGGALHLEAQAKFLLAMLREAQGATDDALDSWRAYKALAAKVPANAPPQSKGPLPARVYSATADTRLAALETRKKLEADYLSVKERIKKNVDAADKATGGK